MTTTPKFPWSICIVCSNASLGTIDDAGVCSRCRPDAGPGSDDEKWTATAVAELVGEEIGNLDGSARSVCGMQDSGFFTTPDSDGFVLTMANGQRFLVQVTPK